MLPSTSRVLILCSRAFPGEPRPQVVLLFDYPGVDPPPVALVHWTLLESIESMDSLMESMKSMESKCRTAQALLPSFENHWSLQVGAKHMLCIRGGDEINVIDPLHQHGPCKPHTQPMGLAVPKEQSI